MRTKTLGTAGLILLFAGLTFVWGAQAGNFVIKGSTTVLPISQRAAEDYMKQHADVAISVSGGGSGDGIKALLDGATDIADSSRFLKAEEIAQAAAKNMLPVPHRIALDCVTPVVQAHNSVKNLTLKQLKDIYTGVVKNWKEVGGSDSEIVVISRETSSGTFEIWEEKVMKKEHVTPRALMQASNGAVAEAAGKNEHAIGYVGLGYINANLKAVSVEGIAASPANALNGSYPITRPLFMFTRGWPEGEVMNFISFLVSPVGQRLVQHEGFVPIYALE